MRLSDVLSKAPDATSMQVDGFLGKKVLGWGKHKKVDVGRVALNFHCRTCSEIRTFMSEGELSCLVVGEQRVSIDVTLMCPMCDSLVEVWFLVAGEDDIFGGAPTVRVERYTENLRDGAVRIDAASGQFADLLGRAQQAYEAGLGAGAMVYLRRIFEEITVEVAGLLRIETHKANGKLRPFKVLLEEVQAKRRIIPLQFSANGYQLFGELSDVIHGNNISEADAMLKYKPCLDLVLGVVDEVNRDNVFSKAIEILGWNIDIIEEIAGIEPAS